MIDINWQQDYKQDFLCPNCKKSQLVLAGNTSRGTKKQFRCRICKVRTSTSVNLKDRSRFIDPRLKVENIYWEENYHGEFICPKCNKKGMKAYHIHENTKRRFHCPECKHKEQESYDIPEIKKIEYPANSGMEWYTSYIIPGFRCPECQEEKMYFQRVDKVKQKKIFKCKSCKHQTCDSFSLKPFIFSRYNDTERVVKTFEWLDNEWDLRTINTNYNERDRGYLIANFTSFSLDWFKSEVKKYIHHLCKSNTPISTIQQVLSSLRFFCRYLTEENILDFHQINRDLMLDYLSKGNGNKTTKTKLGKIRGFFRTGTIKGWFDISQEIIRSADYPKIRPANPDPLSDRVREQIEQNLQLLPDPIARMWIICYFSAMRPSELAFLRQDSLVQEGQYWKLIWRRTKGKDQHEIPISRTIAQVVQEQQEYIQKLWGKDWDYLFCHYRGVSKTEIYMPKINPVRKVLPASSKNPLLVGIRTLIKACDIRDENNEQAEFQNKILRPTRLTDFFEQGHDLALVSAWAGHKHLATTSTYYTKISCDLIEREVGHIQKVLVKAVDIDGHPISYESYPKSFWENSIAHTIELSGTHINTPIYGKCGQPLTVDCHKFRACYTCQSFIATLEKLPQYINVRDELRGKQAKAMSAGQEVLVEQFGTQADQLDKIIAGLHQEAA